jgi:beta-keto acid cleavage enzyme
MVPDERFQAAASYSLMEPAQDRSPPDPAMDRLGNRRCRARRPQPQRTMRSSSPPSGSRWAPTRASLEETLYLRKGELSRGNLPLVQRAVQLAQSMDLGIADVSEAGRLLSLSALATAL